MFHVNNFLLSFVLRVVISVFGMEKNQINRNWCEYRAKVCSGISTRLRVLSGVQNLLEDRDSVSRKFA